jgi:hypothetical protein
MDMARLDEADADVAGDAAHRLAPPPRETKARPAYRKPAST